MHVPQMKVGKNICNNLIDWHRDFFHPSNTTQICQMANTTNVHNTVLLSLDTSKQRILFPSTNYGKICWTKNTICHIGTDTTGPNEIKCLCPLWTVFAIIFLFLLLMEIGSRKMTFSIRLRQNENEEEIPITEMYSPVSELCLHNNRHMNE